MNSIRQRPPENWNDTERPYPLDQCLHHLVEAQVARTPEAVAVVFEDQRLTYRQLDGRANHLARRLQALGIGPNRFVGICLERSLEMVVGLLGILKAGGTYVPLDPEYPADRLAFMMTDAAAPVLLTQTSLIGRLPAQTAHVIDLALDRDQASADPPASAAGPDDRAYMIYTSGSTGRPKGAMNRHRGIVNRLLWMQDEYRLSAADAVLQKTPLSFDVSVWEVFWPLLAGARLVLAKPGGHRDPGYLVDLITQHHVTVLHFVPSMLAIFLEEPRARTCRGLREVICSGEALPYELQQRFFDQLPARLHNLYGPTEAAVDVTYWACERQGPSHSVPIGRPIANAQCYILDEHLQPLPVGQAGELHLGGVPVGDGYHHRPELTAQRFIPDPFRPGQRLYKTGDLARYREDGAIEYLGRLDHQVKIRGFRIELGEIEARLAEHPAVRQVVVVAREDRPGDKRLVAYRVGDAVPVPELRAFLGRTLPDYMVPAAFVRLPALPLTPNGKIDRQALPAPDRERPELPNEFAAPTTPRELALAGIWSAVLGVKAVGIHDNFFELGGDSIRAIQVLARAQEQGWPVTLAQLFQAPTIHGLAGLTGQAASDLPARVAVPAFSMLATADRQRLPAEVVDAYPLSTVQLGMRYHNELNPAAAVFHDVFGYRIGCRLIAPQLEDLLNRLVLRHETLRTAFDFDHFSEPLQLVYPAVRVPLSVVDLRGLSPAEQQAATVAWIAAEKRRSFDWKSAPLVRFHVQHDRDAEFQFLVSFHHSVLDGWSLAALVAEIFQEYSALVKGIKAVPTAPGIPYRDYVALERQTAKTARCRQFWTENLSEATKLTLPRWPKSYRRGGTEQTRSPEIQIAPETFAGLKQLAQTTGVPLRTVLLAAHLRVMNLLAGQPDVMTGVITNGRPEEADGDRMLGLFLNTVPLRLPLTGGTWIDLVRQTFDAERAYLPHRRYPLIEIQKLAGGAALFETAFDFVQWHVLRELSGLPGLDFREGPYFEANDFTLYTVFVLDITSTRLELHLDYDPEQLAEEQIRATLDYYVNVLAEMAARPADRYETFSPLSIAERDTMLNQWNANRLAYEPVRIPELIERQIAATPSAIALVTDQARLSYHELNIRANQLAHHLRRQGVGPETLVGICVERSADMVVGLLAILKAGGAYVPLDPAYPPERTAFILQDAKAKLLLTQTKLLPSLPAHAAPMVDLDTIDLATERPENPETVGHATNLAYVIFTSGSTGRPKGVAIEHRSAVAFIAWARTVFTPAELAGVLFSTSICFDLSIFELFVTLACGGQVILAENALELPSIRAANEVTLINTVPSAIAELVDAGAIPRSVQTVNLAGELLDQSLVDQIYEWPHVKKVYDLYGPSEDTTYSTFTLRTKGGRANIGRPIANTQAYLLDARLQPVPVGVLGELHLGGDGLARGYLYRPDLTAEKFIPDPFRTAPGARLYKTGDFARYLPDGRIEYSGRMDRGVKIRGYRIELGEIQTVLQAHPQLQQNVVVMREDRPGDKRLACYFVPRQQDQAPSVAELREYLQKKLPVYMVPSAFVKLAALPLTPNGKIDQQALPKPEAGRVDLATAYEAPRTDAERTIAGIWQEVLAIPQVGVRDNFFDLGGHSLHLVRVHGKIRAAFQSQIPIVLLFQHPTVSELAQALRQGPDPKATQERVQSRARHQRQAAFRLKELRKKE